ncbi:MAG TPA: glutathione S-transferase family protein [Noviherbaspirillum sp.]|uniref:glutathione S-transferase family protein n=1 Tax=Noviherbaspirillum sp. TaxID=1926288 RepID=UPI002D28B7B1|nr:glutathione S-transferase family protein [Noviherbaspirillum sp.]HYD95018.1 glutathione S-transferase family protein [Noviherbaspirillum sp.]
MITLYHCVSARSFRPLWAMEELGLSYTLKMLPFPPRALLRDYLDINPIGTVPAFFDGELRMTESAAICEYLAAKYGAGLLDVAREDASFGAYLNWLDFGEATLTFPQTLVLRYRYFEPPERQLPQAAEDYQRWFLARLRAVDAAVSKQDFLCAGRFTAADISVGYALMLAEYLGLEPQFPEAVRSYWERLKLRAGYRHALQAQHRAAIDQGISTTPAPLVGR